MDVPINLNKGLLDADIIGEKAYNIFVQERLFGEKNFFLIQLGKFGYLLDRTEK